MLNQLLTKIFGSRNERNLRQYQKNVERINQLEDGLKALNDADLQAKTEEFKQRLANGETLDKILPEAFAVCREASIRTLGLRHYDVQMIGGIALHPQGCHHGARAATCPPAESHLKLRHHAEAAARRRRRAP